MKRAMIQELIKRQLDAKLSGSDIPDEEAEEVLRGAHRRVREARARARAAHLPAATDAKQRAEARKHAATLLKDIDGREKKGEVNAFQSVAMKESKDPLSCADGRRSALPLQGRARESLQSELASAAFDLKNPGDKAGLWIRPPASKLVKAAGKDGGAEPHPRREQGVDPQRMARERRSGITTSG